jgi:hypothetical protein
MWRLPSGKDMCCLLQGSHQITLSLQNWEIDFQGMRSWRNADRISGEMITAQVECTGQLPCSRNDVGLVEAIHAYLDLEHHILKVFRHLKDVYPQSGQDIVVFSLLCRERVQLMEDKGKEAMEKY